MAKVFSTSKVHRIAPLVLVALVWCSGVGAQVVRQYPTAEPLSIALGPDGAMWFTQYGYSVGRIDSSGNVTGFPVPTNDYLDIALGPEGNLWLTRAFGGPSGTIEAAIVELTPTGLRTEFRVSDAGGITAGPDGNLWFTEPKSFRIGRITPTGTVSEFALPTRSAPLDIAAGRDGNLWFTIPGARKVGRITLSGTVTEFSVPFANPYGITAGPGGNI